MKLRRYMFAPILGLAVLVVLVVTASRTTAKPKRAFHLPSGPDLWVSHFVPHAAGPQYVGPHLVVKVKFVVTNRPYGHTGGPFQVGIYYGSHYWWTKMTPELKAGKSRVFEAKVRIRDEHRKLSGHKLLLSAVADSNKDIVELKEGNNRRTLTVLAP